MTSTRRSLTVLGVLAAVMLAVSTGVAQAQPVAPSTFSVVPNGYGALLVTWTTAGGHQAGDTYDIRYEEVENGTLIYGDRDTILTGISGLSHTITGLKHGTRYVVNLRGRRGSVLSDWRDGDGSVDGDQGVGATTISAPDLAVVQGVTAKAGDGSVTVMWTALADPTGAPLARYQVRAQSSTNNVDMYVPGDMTEAMLMGLTNGVEYTVSVRGQASLAGEPDAGRYSTAYSAGVKVTPMAGAGMDDDDDDEEPMPTPALPFVGVLALLAGLLAAGRARLRR